MPVPKKCFIVFLSIFFFSVKGIAQSSAEIIPKEKFLFFRKKLDSFPSFIRSGEVNEYPVCKLPQHAKYYLIKSLITFSARANSLPDSLRNSYSSLYSLMDIAYHHVLAKRFDSASWYLFRALDTALVHHYDGEELHDIRVGLNNIYFLLGNYTSAMKISIKGLEKAEQIGDENRMAHFNNVIGYIYMKLLDFSRANNYYQSYLKQSQNLKDTVEEAHALYNLGDLAIAENQYDQALNLFNESLNLYLSIQSKNTGFHTERKAYVFNKLARCWKLKGNTDRAMQYIKALLAVTNLTADVNAYDKADYFINGGDIFNRLGKPDSALILLKKGLSIAVEINHREFKRDAFQQIAISFSQKKIYDSAFIYQTMFSNLKDSIMNEVNREEIYQRDNDLQVERQQQVQKIAMQRQQFGRNIIIAVSVFLLLTMIFLYNRYQLRQKNRYQKELNRQQNELFNAIAVSQDQERKRIAQDIHDSLGAILSAAKLKMSVLAESISALPDEQQSNYQVSIQLLDEASLELRNISHNIMPATLTKLGMVAALRNLSDSISSYSGLQINFLAHDFHQRIDESKEISIYRIILELINNVVKHAKADKVTVQLIRFSDHINITVEDTGKGFDYSRAVHEKKGIGLGNIISRVDYLKGSISFDAVPGRGTTVIIDVPV